jgi:carbon monoxide dehydrogenase subunit G
MAPVPARDTREISATGLVPASPEDVYAFLCDLENHWLLADRFVEVLNLDGTGGGAVGGKVRVRGPLGLGRTATTRVLTRDPSGSITGTAELTGGTQALVRWTLVPEGGATRVELAAQLQLVGRLDRFLLALGGRRWIHHRFRSILRTLAAQELSGPAPRPVPAPPGRPERMT